MTRRVGRVFLALLCFAAFSRPASAQVYTGRIDITAVDKTGAILAGVTVEVTGGLSKMLNATDSRGEIHLVNLPPARYTVRARKTGFTEYVNDDVPVGAGATVTLKVTLDVGAITASADVTAVTPVTDPKRQSQSTNISLEMLQQIPSARDPWVVLQSVPGVFVDRINVGGAESGQQSNVIGKGSVQADNTWNIDGIAITDVAANGASPTYYDFDMFQEMQVTTGGADPMNATSGVSLNFILRSGTNSWRGSSRAYFMNHSLQGDNISKSLQGVLSSYNRINSYNDDGVEAGGPIVKDRMWIWAAVGRTNPKSNIFGLDPANPGSYIIATRDATLLQNYSLKTNAQLDSNTRLSFTFFRGDKSKEGRGASAFHPDETTWNQTGPADFYKGEGNFTLSNSAFLTARFAYTANSFALVPRGGLDAQVYRDDGDVWHGSFENYSTSRPQYAFSADGNIFKGNHELKYGFGWRKANVTSSTSWPGNGIVTISLGAPTLLAQIVRPALVDGNGKYLSGYAGDTITIDKLTLNLGVRWSRDSGSVNALAIPAATLDPSGTLPAINLPKIDNAIVWNSVAPRLGLAYSLAKDQKTIVRASYARFASQLPSNLASFVVGAPYYSYAYFLANDTNHNGIADPNEFTSFLGNSAGLDPATGANPNKIGKYNTPMTDEVVFGVDQQLAKNLGLTVAYTWRRFSNFNWLHYTGVTGSDYTQKGTLTGTDPVVGAFSIPYYTINPGAIPANGEETYEARPGYSQKAKGIEISATKRMSHRWMARLAFSQTSHREYFANADAQGDPTPSLPTQSTFSLLSPNVNGGSVVVQTAGSGKSNIFLVEPRYQIIMTGSYEMMHGIMLGVNYELRDGFAAPYFESSVPGTADAGSGGLDKTLMLVPTVDAARLPAVNSLDVRFGKAFKTNRADFNIDVDLFNLINSAAILGRQFDIGASNANSVTEIMNPRIVRFGLRVSFK